MKHHLAYYESFGCQMNAFDIEVIESFMADEGFATAATPERADVIVVNTCSVREHAERRALGRLSDLLRFGAVTVVCGCMAQRLGDRLFELAPGLAIIAGPDSYRRLPSAVSSVLESGGRISLLDVDGSVDYTASMRPARRPVTRYLAITRGCENFCTYCIVPYVRGAVRSRAAADIVEEVRRLPQSGCREVTLIGQNVMAYRDGEVDFPDLLKEIVDQTEIERIRFLTTHPRDVDVRVFELMAAERRVCPHIHLPLQAGSDSLLRAMNRGYGRDRYVRIVEEARRIVPDIAVTTDIIVGFPGERDDDFRRTLEVVEELRFDAAFTFKYSPREGTRAADLADDVPDGVKRERLRILNGRIGDIRRRILTAHLGSTAEILLDGSVEKEEYHWKKGRTPQYRNVLIDGARRREGDIVEVVLKELRNYTYIGEATTRR